MKPHIAIAGAGFAGAVLARELAESERFRVSVYDERKHVAGNCHTRRDDETEIMVHEFGPHVFHTNQESIWDYITRWGKFEPFETKVKANTEKGIFPFPINLQTINQFYGKKLSPSEARDFLGSLADHKKKEPLNFEEQVIQKVGKDFYQVFFKDLTKKRWGMEARLLPTSLMERVPVHFSYGENYYDKTFQGIPLSGYTEIVRRILDHQNITVRLGQRLDASMKDQFEHIFWSGPMDGFFKCKAGKLGYRTMSYERFVENGDYQGCPIIHYCEEKIPFTRVIEHKHFSPWEDHKKTVCFKEFSKICEEGDVPYYPLQMEEDDKIFKDYVKLIQADTKVTFIGRLGTYRNLEIDEAIAESLDLAKTCLTAEIKSWPKFSNNP
jgi:UDP-galactopyranose mutase